MAGLLDELCVNNMTARGGSRGMPPRR